MVLVDPRTVTTTAVVSTSSSSSPTKATRTTTTTTQAVCTILLLFSCWCTWWALMKIRLGGGIVMIDEQQHTTTTTTTSGGDRYYQHPFVSSSSSSSSSEQDEEDEEKIDEEEESKIITDDDVLLEAGTEDLTTTTADEIAAAAETTTTTEIESSSSIVVVNDDDVEVNNNNVTTVHETTIPTSSVSSAVVAAMDYSDVTDLNVTNFDGLTKDGYIRERDILLKELQASSDEDNEKLRKYIARIDVPIQWLPKAAMACPHILRDRTTSGGGGTIYSPSYGDRSGAVVEHMLNAAAYAYRYNFTFGGSIVRVHDVGFSRKRVLHESLINSMGLEDYLQFVIPPRADIHDVYFVRVETCLDTYEPGMTSFSPDFVKHIQQQQTIPSSLIQISDDTTRRRRRQRVAVHMRRGDAQPCTEDKFRKRYRSNSYYLQILDEFVIDIENADVTIYSESDSFESFDVFRERGYNVELDGFVTDAWTNMRTADIFIMSPNSDFSSVPGLLNPNDVYFTSAINHWIEVPHRIQNQSEYDLQYLVDTQCKQWLIDNPKHREKFTDW